MSAVQRNLKRINTATYYWLVCQQLAPQLQQYSLPISPASSKQAISVFKEPHFGIGMQSVITFCTALYTHKHTHTVLVLASKIHHQLYSLAFSNRLLWLQQVASCSISFLQADSSPSVMSPTTVVSSANFRIFTVGSLEMQSLTTKAHNIMVP